MVTIFWKVPGLIVIITPYNQNPNTKKLYTARSRHLLRNQIDFKEFMKHIDGRNA